MRWKLFIEFCLTVSIVSILAGDLFLPQPYRSGSQQLKVNLNHFLVSLLPRKTIIDVNKRSEITPYPLAQTNVWQNKRIK